MITIHKIHTSQNKKTVYATVLSSKKSALDGFRGVSKMYTVYLENDHPFGDGEVIDGFTVVDTGQPFLVPATNPATGDIILNEDDTPKMIASGITWGEVEEED